VASILIVLGLVLLVAGLLWPYLGQIGLGRLPGDIIIERKNVTL
jgi:multisubunit Na+/H+ antiporter MnhG subunit